jgi:hypothetical protein
VGYCWGYKSIAGGPVIRPIENRVTAMEDEKPTQRVGYAGKVLVFAHTSLILGSLALSMLLRFVFGVREGICYLVFLVPLYVDYPFFIWLMDLTNWHRLGGSFGPAFAFYGLLLVLGGVYWYLIGCLIQFVIRKATAQARP